MIQSPATVFVVDDDESVRRALRRLLKSVGFKVELFVSAEAFLASGSLGKSGCLVLDVRMPGISGFELQRRLCDSGCEMPIIFITAHEDEEARLRAMRAGAVAFLPKPFGDEAFLRAIREAIRRLESKERDNEVS